MKRWIAALLSLCLCCLPAQAQFKGGLDFGNVGFNAPAAVAGSSFSITGVGTAGSAGSGSSTTLQSITYGSGCNTVVMGIGWGSAASAVINAGGVTLDGSQTLTAVTGSLANNLTNGIATQMYYITSPTGTAGTPTVSFSAALNGGLVVQEWCIKTATATPSAGAAGCSDTSGNACPSNIGETSTTASVTVPSGGGLMGFCIGNLPATYSFTNITKDNDISYRGQFGTNQAGSGHATGGAGSSVTVTCADTGADSVTWTLSLAAMSP